MLSVRRVPRLRTVRVVNMNPHDWRATVVVVGIVAILTTLYVLTQKPAPKVPERTRMEMGVEFCPLTHDVTYDSVTKKLECTPR